MADRWIVDDDPSPRFPIYTRGNIGEVYPLPATPLTWTLGVHGASEPGWRDAFVRFGCFDHDEFADDRLEILGCFGGYGYLNVSISRILAVRTPGLTPEQIDYTFWGDMPGVPAYEPQPGHDDPRFTERVQQTLQWILTTERLPELEDDRRKVAELRAARPHFTPLSDRQLVDYTRDQLPELRRLFSQHIFISYCSTVPVGILASTCEALGDPTMAMRLVAGIGEVDSAAPSLAMWDLSRVVAGSGALTGAFDAGVAGLLDRLRGSGSAEAAAFLNRFDGFLFEYGSRGQNEWETSSPSWETKPELALAAIDRMRMAPDEQSPLTHTDALVADREEMAAHVTACVAGDPETKGQVVAALRAAKVFLAGRERTKTNIIRLINELRVANDELGRRMVEAGHLDHPHGYSMLMESELDAFLENPGSFRETIRERQARYDELFDLEPPFVVVGEVPPLSEWARRDRQMEQASAGTSLSGIPGCPGHATGRARVILDPSDPSALEPGDVLVAPITDPAWTPLFVPAAAVVVDVGAQISHAVIVSRELGIPCVVSVADATRRIRDGAIVTVDGTAGTVTIDA